jgi:CRP/FNR family cyclic AMP-dependent transcriptional regulator
LSARTVVINEGFTADRVFVICAGSVKLMSSSADGRLLILRVATAGEVIGVSALTPVGRYRITAITVRPSIIKSIPRLQFLAFAHDFKEVSLCMSAAVAKDYNSAVLSARRLGLSSTAAGKLASALLEWARKDHLDDCAYQPPDCISDAFDA